MLKWSISQDLITVNSRDFQLSSPFVYITWNYKLLNYCVPNYFLQSNPMNCSFFKTSFRNVLFWIFASYTWFALYACAWRHVDTFSLMFIECKPWPGWYRLLTQLEALKECSRKRRPKVGSSTVLPGLSSHGGFPGHPENHIMKGENFTKCWTLYEGGNSIMKVWHLS